MTDVHKLKESTCKDVHSLLLSGNQAVTLRQLEKDYRDFIGSRIPFQPMGYVNLESYLRDSPSYFKLYWDGPQLMVKHVTNAETEHIELMLSRQKPKRQRKKANGGYRGGYGGSQRYPKPRYQLIPQPAPPRVHNTLRGEIRGLLMSYPNGILMCNFDDAYAKRYGSFINFKRLGFITILDMLGTMTDIITIVHEQSRIYRIYPRTTATRTKAIIDKARQEADDQRMNNLPPRLRRQAEEKIKSCDQQVAAPDTHHQGQGDHSEAEWHENIYDKSGVNHIIQREIQQLLGRHKEGIWSTRFQAEYRTAYKKELDLRNQGYNSVINLMADLPHIVTIERANQRDWLLHDARLKKPTNQKTANRTSERNPPKSLPCPTDCFNTASPIDNEMKETIRQVIAYHQKGVLLDELPMVFKQLTGEELVPSDLGYANNEKLLIALDDIIHMEYSPAASPGKLLLYPQFKESVPRRDKLKNLTIPKSVSKSHDRREVPSDAVGPDSVYRQQTIPLDRLQEDPMYIEVYVSTVINPSHFWLQLKGPDTTDALEALMDRLEEVYCNTVTAEEYVLPDELVSLDQVCVAVYPPERDWHRCRISGFKGLDFVELYYIDYGSTHVVTRKSLKFLKWKDFELPAQAIPARLSNIKPVNGEWTREARDLMLHMVSNHALIALVTGVDLDGTLSVCLTDTSGDTDIHVNDELVGRGLAVVDIVNDPESYLPPPIPEVNTPSTTTDNEANTQNRNEYNYSVSGQTGESECERYIKYVELTPEYSVHIICHKDQAYVTSGEISSLLWPGADMLRSMLRQKKMNLIKVVLPKTENVDLFDEFKREEVGGTVDNDGKLKTHVTVFQLSSVVDVLDKFDHPSEDLKTEIQRQVDSFNPLDPYWKGTDSDDEEEEDDEDCITFGRQTLEMALQSLQFKRKRILQAMQEMDSDNTINLVEELQNVEKQLRDFKERLKALDQLEKSGEGDNVPAKNMTSEDDWICSAVAEQDDTYLKTNNAQADSVYIATPLVHEETPKIAPLNVAQRAGVKTNPVAPMPPEPRAQVGTKSNQVETTSINVSSSQNPSGVPQAPLGHSLLTQSTSCAGVVPNGSGGGLMDSSTALALMPMMMQGLDPKDPQFQQKLLLMNQYMLSMQSFVNQNFQQLNSNVSSSVQSGVGSLQLGVGSLQPGVSSLQAGMTSTQPAMTSTQPGMTSLQPGMTSLQPGMTSSQPGMSSLQLGMTLLQPGMTSSQPGVTSLQPGVSTLQPGMTSLQPGVSSLQPGMTSLQPGLAPAVGVGLPTLPTGFGSSIGMGVDTYHNTTPLTPNMEPSYSLQGRGRAMSNIRSPPGGLYRKQ